MWWNNADGTLRNVPRDAFWSWGLHDSFIVVIPSLDIVVARAGNAWKRDGGDPAVFKHPGYCYRSSISYNAALKRYFWCQIIPGGTTRFEGGFGIYDAPEPWGPWTTVYFTEKWDVGPGETSGIPTKWISNDGRTIHLVFSGDDHFSVRRATLITRRVASWIR